MAKWLTIASLTLVCEVPAWAQTIADRVRAAQEQSLTSFTIGSVDESQPRSLDELVKNADLAAVARISRARTYVNDADTEILTDYTITPIRVLAGTLPVGVSAPGVATNLLVTTYGGELVRDGVRITAIKHGVEPLRDGGSYLLFLTRLGKAPGVYQILNAAVFDLSAGAARPLAKSGQDLFPDIANLKYDELEPRIIATGRKK